jgi:hypothetical protein
MMEWVRDLLEKRRIARFLDEAGHSSDDIAATLANLGIRGKRGDQCACPIVAYLKSRGIRGDINVGPLWVILNDDICIDTPQAVRQFIESFDNRAYPDLDLAP